MAAPVPEVPFASCLLRPGVQDQALDKGSPGVTAGCCGSPRGEEGAWKLESRLLRLRGCGPPPWAGGLALVAVLPELLRQLLQAVSRFKQEELPGSAWRKGRGSTSWTPPMKHVLLMLVFKPMGYRQRRSTFTDIRWKSPPLGR